MFLDSIKVSKLSFDGNLCVHFKKLYQIINIYLFLNILGKYHGVKLN